MHHNLIGWRSIKTLNDYNTLCWSLKEPLWDPTISRSPNICGRSELNCSSSSFHLMNDPTFQFRVLFTEYFSISCKTALSTPSNLFVYNPFSLRPRSPDFHAIFVDSFFAQHCEQFPLCLVEERSPRPSVISRRNGRFPWRRSSSNAETYTFRLSLRRLSLNQPFIQQT